MNINRLLRKSLFLRLLKNALPSSRKAGLPGHAVASRRRAKEISFILLLCPLTPPIPLWRDGARSGQATNDPVLPLVIISPSFFNRKNAKVTAVSLTSNILTNLHRNNLSPFFNFPARIIRLTLE